MADNKIRTSIIQEAKNDFEEIRKYAIEGAKKDLEKDIDAKLKQVIENVLNEDLSISVGDTSIDVGYREDDEEEIKIEKDGEEIDLGVSDTSVSDDDDEEFDLDSDIDADGEEEDGDDFDIEDDGEDIEVDLMGGIDDEFEDDEFEDGDEEIEIEDPEDDEIDLDEDLFSEQEQAAPQPSTPQQPAPAAPQQDQSLPEEPQGDQDTQVQVEPSMADIGSKLDMLIGLMQGDQQGEDGEIEIIDDTDNVDAAPEQDAPQQPQNAQPMAEEFDLEDGDLFEVEDDLLGELELEDSDLDEIGGISHSVERRAGRNQDFRNGDRHHSPESQSALRENKNSRNESKKDENIVKENESLKNEINDYQQSFVKLRKQFNEMQSFNAKLAYMNKLLMTGGLSNEEKVKISERFDGTSSVEESEKLYKTIIRENSLRSSSNGAASKIKSRPTNVAKSKSEPLYESREITELKKMQRLAGILPMDEE